MTVKQELKRINWIKRAIIKAQLDELQKILDIDGDAITIQDYVEYRVRELHAQL